MAKTSSNFRVDPKKKLKKEEEPKVLPQPLKTAEQAWSEFNNPTELKKPAIVETPETKTARQKAEGDAYIRLREQTASRANVSSRRAAEMIQGQTTAYEQSEAAQRLLTTQQQQQQQAIQQFGQTDVPMPEPNEIIQGGVAKTASALKAAGAGAIGGATIGAGIGSLIVPGAGTVVGGVAGGVIGGLTGLIGGMTASKRQTVKEAKNLAAESDANFNNILMYLKAGGDPLIARKAWNQQKADILYAQKILKQETQKDLDRFMSGGADELVDVNKTIELFDFYEYQWNLALAKSPNLQILPRTQQTNNENS